MGSPKKVVQEKENNSTYNSYTTETSGYLQEPRTSLDTNPFDWLRLIKKKYPCVAKVAAKLLAIPATEASSIFTVIYIEQTRVPTPLPHLGLRPRPPPAIE